VNKWAAGISDTLALGLLNEFLVDGPPIVAAPCAKPALLAHPAYSTSLQLLREEGVHFVEQEEVTSRGRWACDLRLAVGRAEDESTGGDRGLSCKAALLARFVQGTSHLLEVLGLLK